MTKRELVLELLEVVKDYEKSCNVLSNSSDPETLATAAAHRNEKLEEMYDLLDVIRGV